MPAKQRPSSICWPVNTRTASDAQSVTAKPFRGTHLPSAAHSIRNTRQCNAKVVAVGRQGHQFESSAVWKLPLLPPARFVAVSARSAKTGCAPNSPLASKNIATPALRLPDRPHPNLTSGSKDESVRLESGGDSYTASVNRLRLKPDRQRISADEAPYASDLRCGCR